MSNSTNLTPDNNDDFYAELRADAEALAGTSNRLPSCQVINPKKGFEKRSETNYGIFIPAEQAELAGFEPDETIWKPHSQTFESGNVEDGFLAVSLRMVIVLKSELEVYLEGPDKFERCAGLAYVSRVKTAYAEREGAKLKTRYLIGFVDKANQLLHQVPFSFKTSGGFGGAFGEEITHLRHDFAKPLTKAMRLRSLNEDSHSYCVAAFTFYGYNPSGGKQPFLAPVARALPLLQGDPGLEEAVEVNRKNGRRVKLTGEEVSSLYILRNNPSRATIDEWRETYADFAEIPGKKDADAQPQAPAREEAEDWKGTFDLGKVVFSEGGDQATTPFTRADGRVFAATMDANLFTGLSAETCAVWGWVEGGKGLTVTAVTNLSDNVPF
jgi:hypothetical protein